MSDVRLDDWKNTFTALGSFRDKSSGVYFGQRPRLSTQQLDALYEQSALAARVCDLFGDEAFKYGWRFGSTTGGNLSAEELHTKLQDFLGIDQLLLQTCRASRLYGAAGIAILDAGDPSQPLQVRPGMRVAKPVVFTASELQPDSWDSQLGSETYGQFLDYRVAPPTGGSFTLHSSRALVLEHAPISTAARLQSATRWGPSALDRVYDSLARYGSANRHAVSILYNAAILVLKFEGYRAAAKTKDGRETIRRILETTREGIDVLGLLGLDASDVLESVQHSIPGLDQVISQMRDAFGADLDFPKEIAFNESPAGLNAGELSGPLEIFYSKVAQYQKRLEPVINQLIAIGNAALGLGLTDWKIEWLPLWIKSDSALAATAATNATTDRAYLDAGVLTAEEIRKARFEDQEQGLIQLEPDQPADPFDLSIQPDEVEAEQQAQSAEQPVSETAMNGAQIASLMEIVQNVSAGMLPRDSAIGILGAAFPNLRGREEQILGSAGLNTPALAPEPAQTVAIPDDAVPIQEAAKRFGVPTRTITRAIELGSLGHWQIGSRRTVSLAEVAGLAKSHEVPPVEEGEAE